MQKILLVFQFLRLRTDHPVILIRIRIRSRNAHGQRILRK